MRHVLTMFFLALSFALSGLPRACPKHTDSALYFESAQVPRTFISSAVKRIELSV